MSIHFKKLEQVIGAADIAKRGNAIELAKILQVRAALAQNFMHDLDIESLNEQQIKNYLWKFEDYNNRIKQILHL